MEVGGGGVNIQSQPWPFSLFFIDKRDADKLADKPKDK